MPDQTLTDLAFFPRGVILPWYARSGAFPTGWAVCDGTNGTPDLRSRFLMGVSDMADVGASGGQNAIAGWRTAGHALTPNEMPHHTHRQVTKLHQGPEGVPHPLEYAPNPPNGNSNNWSWQGSETGGAGGDTPHDHALPNLDNRPAYVGVLFLMKL